MKRIISCLVILVVLLVSLNGQKFASFDYLPILKEMPETTEMTSEIKILHDKLRKKREAMVADLRKEYSNAEQYLCAVASEQQKIVAKH